MAVSRQQLVQMLEPAVAGLGFELADLEMHVGKGRQLLRVFIDADGGVTVDDCEAVSRQVSSVLDVADVIPGNYTLEVSSPGLDRRLVKPAHFERHTGAQVQVQLRRIIDGRRRVRGILVDRNDERLSLKCDNDIQSFPVADVESVRLVPDFGKAAKAS
jgi:ribosome maturation factor RimP